MNVAARRVWSWVRQRVLMSLAARVAIIAVVSLAFLAGASFIAYNHYNTQLMRILVDPQIAGTLDALDGAVGRDRGGDVVLRRALRDDRFTRPTSGYYWEIARVDDDAAVFQVVRISGSLFDEALKVPPSMQDWLQHSPPTDRGVRYVDLADGPEGAPVRIGARDFSFSGSSERYLFIVAMSPDNILRQAGQVAAIAFAAFAGLCALMVLAVTLLQMMLVLNPLAGLRRDIVGVRRGQADRLAREYAAELQPLAGELNALLDHNREVVERARRHVGNLAHALKTPIAVLKNAQHAGGDDEVTKQSVSEMEAFVERELRRARVAARAETKAGPQATTIGYRTPVLTNLSDLVFMMEQKFDHVKALDIELDGSAGDATFRGEREDLLEMAANLLDNACKYGKSHVVVRLTPGAGMLDIVVEDDGPGLTPEEIARVMARGARLDEAAPGQGLGLSILTETVALYAGELTFGRSELGGLKATLRLPATD